MVLPYLGWVKWLFKSEWPNTFWVAVCVEKINELDDYWGNQQTQQNTTLQLPLSLAFHALNPDRHLLRLLSLCGYGCCTEHRYFGARTASDRYRGSIDERRAASMLLYKEARCCCLFPPKTTFQIFCVGRVRLLCFCSRNGAMCCTSSTPDPG